MQSIQRTSSWDTTPFLPVSVAASLATLIDRRARVGREEGRDGPGPDGNVLIWLDDQEPGHGPVAASGRGVIVVMHGANQAVGAQSFIVSFPAGIGGKGRQLGTVSRLLATMGWSLLAHKRRQTEVGHADTAVLVNTSRFGGEQRLWLAEPVEASGQHVAPELRPWAAARPNTASDATA